MGEQAGYGTEEVLQGIIESLPLRVFWKDRELRYLGCNSRFSRDAGLKSPQALVGKTDLDMPWKEQAEAYRADDEQVMASGVARLNYEEPQTTSEGATIWLRTSKVPLYDGDRGVVGILGIYEEITELRLTQEAEQRSKRALRLLSACNSALVHATDEADLLTEICRLAVEAGGYRMGRGGFAEHSGGRLGRLERCDQPVRIAAA